MRWGDRVRRVLISGLTLGLIAPLVVPVAPAAADNHEDSPEVKALKGALDGVLSGLTGLDVGDAMLDPVPLTPTGLDRILSLPTTLTALAAAVDDAPTELDAFIDELVSGIDAASLPGLDDDLLEDLGIETLEIAADGVNPAEFSLDDGALDLVVTLERAVGSPLAVLHDIVAYDPDAIPVDATLSVPLTLEFGPDVDDLDPRVDLGQVELGAEVAASFTAGASAGDPAELDPLGMNVGILAVEATGDVSAILQLTAGVDGTVPLSDWVGTPPRDLFAFDVATASATADLDLDAVDLDGLENAGASLSLDWPPDPEDVDLAELTGWQDAVSVDPGDLGDFRNVFVEEVIAGLAQLAVSLGATQRSGVADLRLPLLGERASELGHLGQGILDWLLDQTVVIDDEERALARIDDDGRLQLLDELDREVLVGLGLTDVQAILTSLAKELGLEDLTDLGATYLPGETALHFDLGWERGPGDLGLGADADQLSFRLSDRLREMTGLSGLVDAATLEDPDGAQPASQISATPEVTADLAVAFDLTFDDVRELFDTEYEFDLDAFRDAGHDPDDMIAVSERVQLLTGDSFVGLDVPVDATLDLAGTIGFLGLSASTGDTPLRLIDAAGDGPMLSVAFVEGEPNSGRLSLAELLDGLGDDPTGVVDVTVDVTVPTFDLTVAAEVGGTELGGPLELGGAWDSAVGELDFATVDASGLEELLDFAFSPDPHALLDLLLQGIDELTASLEARVRGGSALGRLPLVDLDLADMLTGLREVREQVGELATDPDATLQEAGTRLNCLLVEAFGAGTCDGDEPSLLTLDVEPADGATPTTVRAAIELDICGSPGECLLAQVIELPFDLDLAEVTPDHPLAAAIGSMVELSTSGVVDLDYDLTASLHAGVELPNVTPGTSIGEPVTVDGTPRVVLFDDTNLDGRVDLEAVATDLEVAIGPLNMQGAKEDTPAVARLGATFGFEHPGDGRVGLDELAEWLGEFDATFEGSGNKSCPTGIEPAAFAQVSGTVTDAHTEDGVEATVTAEGSTPDGDDVTESVDADEDGEFDLELPAGDYTITAASGDHEAQEAEVTLGAGDQATITYTLRPDAAPGVGQAVDDAENATISGTVTDAATGDGLAATVSANGQSDTADSNGAYSIDVEDGETYTVTATMNGFEPLNTEVEIGAGEAAVVNFSLVPDVEGSAVPDIEEADPADGLDERDRENEGTVDGVDACARIPLYLRGDWFGDIALVAHPLTAEPGDWQLELPDDLVDRLTEELLDWRLLLDGLRHVVGRLARGLDASRHGARVPVVGDVIDGGAGLAVSFESALDSLDKALDDLEDEIGDITDPGELSAALDDLLDEAMRDAFGEHLAPSLDVDLFCGEADGQPAPCDGGHDVSDVDGGEVTLSMGDGDDTTLEDFDLGVPGLRLDVDGSLEAGYDWEVELAFGLDRSGFYLRTHDDDGEAIEQIAVRSRVALPDEVSGDLALLHIDLERREADAHADEQGASGPIGPRGDGEGDPDLQLTASTTVPAGEGSDGRVPLHGLLAGDAIVLGLEGVADLRYGITTLPSLPGLSAQEGDPSLPTLRGDLLLVWGLNLDSRTGLDLASAATPEVFGFRDVEVDMGSFLDEFLGPILAEVRRFTAPFQPVIDTISSPVPGLSDLSESLGMGEITLIDLFEAVDGNDLTFIKRVVGLVDLAERLPGDADGSDEISLGEFDIDVAEVLRAPKPASQRDTLIAGLDVIEQQFVDRFGPQGLLSTAADGADEASDADQLPFGAAGSDHSVHRARTGGGFSFPAFAQPSQLFGLLMGQDPVLARWDSGDLEAGFAFSHNFPPIFIGPVPVAFSLSAAAQIAGRFAIGYDTYGIRRAVEQARGPEDVSGHAVLGQVPMLFTGVFLDDLDENGNQVPELVLSSEFAAGAGASIGIISAGLELGLRALIDFDLRDPTGTGRIRIQHIIDNFHTPICLFEVGGQLDVFLRTFVKISLGIGSKTSRFTIFDIVVLRMDDIVEAFCADRPPDLAEVLVNDAGERILVVNVGNRGDQRGIAPGQPDEKVVIRPLDHDGDRNTAFSVAAFGEYEEFTGITGVQAFGRTVQIVADGGEGEDELVLLDGSDADRDGEDPENPPEIDDEFLDIAPDTIPMVANAVLCGGPGDDVIVGGRGDDILVGDGTCTVTGGEPADQLDEGEAGTAIGIEVSLEENHVDDPGERGPGHDGDDRIHATAGDNLVFGLGGHDQLHGGTGTDVLVGGLGDDQLHGGDPFEGDLGDLLIGGHLVLPPGGGDLPNGAHHLDDLVPASGAPSAGGDNDVFGGRGDDVLIGGHGGATLTGDEWGEAWIDHQRGGGANFLDGGPGDDRIFGGPGGDELYGGRGDDLLHGGPGDDLLIGGTTDDEGQPGRNVLIGGPGDDELVAHDAQVARDDDARAEDVRPIHGNATDDAVLIGGSLRDDAGHPGDDDLWGGGGDDLLIGDDAIPPDMLVPQATTGGGSELVTFPAAFGAGAFEVFAARDGHGYPLGLDPEAETGLLPSDEEGGHDRLYGGPGDDTLIGGPGHDVLVGGWPVRTTSDGTSVARIEAGDDLLIGGRGDDLLLGDHGDVVPRGEQDDPDAVGADVEAQQLRGADDATSNRLIGGRAGQQPLGGATDAPGHDRLLAGAHGDVLVGDDGHITADGDVADDRHVTVLLDVGGKDELVGGPGDDRLFGGPNDDILLGGGGDDHLEGGPGDDQLFGQDGEDVLIGGSSRPGVPSGDNLLVGGPGDDALAGDNARIERAPAGQGVRGSGYLVELFDVEGLDPAASGTDGADVLVGGSLDRDTSSDDLLFGQGGEDLLFGDRARALPVGHPDALNRYGEDVVANARWGWFVPVETASGGDDHLDGGPGNDRLFGGPGDDTLVGGSSTRVEFDDRPEPDEAGLLHLVPPPLTPVAAPEEVEIVRQLEGVPSGDDLLVGGAGDDRMFGDNADPDPPVDESEAASLQFFGMEFGPTTSVGTGGVELLDVAYVDDSPAAGTGGDDVIIGGVIARPHDQLPAGGPGDDVAFGQGGDDLLIGDHATRLGDERRFAPLLLDEKDDRVGGGDDHLEGGPGDDVLFGGLGDDILVGGTSDLAVGDAGERGVVAGDDLLVGGPGRDVALGDNGRVHEDLEPSGDDDLPSWWATGRAGAAVEPFDEHLLGEEVPHGTFGDDLLVGGSLRGDQSGLEPLAQGATAPGDDLLHGQGGDDALFGDDVVVSHEEWEGGSGADAWQSLRRELAQVAGDHTDTWPLSSLEYDDQRDELLGGDDLMLGGPGDDIMFGGPGQDDMIGGSWDAGRLDGRDEMDAGPGHDVAAGDNARITRPLVDGDQLDIPEGVDVEDDLLLCQTYRHLEESALEVAGQDERLEAWKGLTGDHATHDEFGLVSDCMPGEPDPEQDGIVTRVVRDVEMLDRLDGDEPTIDEDDISHVAGSDLIWGGDGDNTIIGQFDDTDAFEVDPDGNDPWRPVLGEGDDGGSDAQRGWRATRVVEWCRVDDAFAALLEDGESRDAFDGLAGDHLEDLDGLLGGPDHAAALAAYVGIYQGDPDDPYDLAQIAFAGDVLCGGPGEDTILGDQGIVTDIVEDGGRELLIEPQQPFVSDTRFREGTRTRQVELTDITTFDHFERNVGGDDLILGGPGGDAIHGGAGDTLINGNAGDNYIFGGDGDDVIWGGRGDDHLYSGYGDTYLDVRPRPATDGFDGDPPAWFLVGVEADTYQGVDEIYGGWGQDVLQADEASEGPNEEDRLMAWAGAHNLHYVCASTYGAWVSIRNIEPGLLDYLIDKAEGHGALTPGSQDTSGFRELALVYNRDMRHNANPPHPETPGNFTCGAADPASGPGGGDDQ